jgi:hypothetical protein
MSEYPECEKMSRAREEGSQKIGEFLEWLETQGIHLVTELTDEQLEELADGDDPGLDCEWRHYRQCMKTREQLIADFFGIDLKKVEEERRAMIEALRKENEKKDG